MLKLGQLTSKVTGLFPKQQVVFWFSSRELLVSYQQRKKRITLDKNSGFALGQINDQAQAVSTISEVLHQAKLLGDNPLKQLTATVFVSSTSSPLERSIIKKTFRQAGLSKVSLVTYATALRSFASRQNMQAGVGIYVGQDLGEALGFSPQDQAVFSLDYSLQQVVQELQSLLREQQKLEVSLEAAMELYLALAKQPSNYTIRGRNIQTQEVGTSTLSNQDLEQLLSFFRQKLELELRPLVSSALFQELSPENWLIVGDPVFNSVVRDKFQGKTLFLSLVEEVIQGVQWL